jgi:hypothetical protein
LADTSISLGEYARRLRAKRLAKATKHPASQPAVIVAP